MKNRRITDGICPLKQIPRSQRTRHGMTGTPEHRGWRSMLERCHNPRNPGYKLYGGRGIVVCEEWRDSFINFFSYVGKRPSDKHSIDRIKNDLPYQPGNVKWSVKTEQQNNLRKNVKFTFNGETLGLREWSRRIGIGHNTIANRIRKGLPPELVLSPKKHWKGWSPRSEATG